MNSGSIKALGLDANDWGIYRLEGERNPHWRLVGIVPSAIPNAADKALLIAGAEAQKDGIPHRRRQLGKHAAILKLRSLLPRWRRKMDAIAKHNPPEPEKNEPAENGRRR